MSFELKVTEKTIGSLAINYEQLKQELGVQLVQFKGMVVTEDKIIEAKSTRATLNKVSQVIDDRRKELKKEFLKPYELVESQAKELVGMINDVNGEIDKQIKAFEEKEKEEKRTAITNLWDTLHFNKVKVEQVFNERWLNKGFSLANIEEEMKDKILDIIGDLDLIESLCPDKQKTLTLKAKYLTCLDYKKVLSDYNAEEAAKKILTEPVIITPQEVIDSCERVESSEEVVVGLPAEEVYTLCFEVIATEKQITELSKFLKEHNYNYKAKKGESK